MNKKNLFKKSLAVGIIVLFIGAGAATGINGKINRPDINEKILNNSSMIPNQNVCSLKFNTFDKTEEKQNNVNLPLEAANKIYETLEKLKHMIVQKPRNDETQKLKNEFIELLDTYGLIPAGLSKDYILSLLNPSWLKNKQKTPKTRTILSKNYISPITEKIINLQQIFKNCFGKTILNIFDKNNIIIPSDKTTATASFCSISSGGSGTTLPIFLLPRPRAIAAWTAPEALTMVGELHTTKGFYAEGAQSGSMLGFTGLGLTFSFPGEIFYGFVGYALYTKISADIIEFVNQEPVISDENPPDGNYDVPVSLSKLSFKISDLDGDLMDYTVTTNPNIGSGSGNNKKNGIYTVSISGLEGNTKYTWHVVVKDEYNTVEKYYSFTTEMVAPVVSDPLPLDKAKDILVNLSHLSFNLKDFQGDQMDYTVETSPNIGSSSGNNVGDGTYTCDVNGINYSTEYKWYINVTDGAHWTYKVFSFQTELKMIFNPFEEGWQYRKQITIDHNMVTGDLINFPVLISTTDPDLRDKAQDDGDDILFMDGSGVANRLYHEIELFDGTSGKLVAWVNISDISSIADTIFYMYYSNPDCISQECPVLVWDSDYLCVLHMNGNTWDAIDDSTKYHNDATGESNTPVYRATSKVGYGVDFDDSDAISFSSPIRNTVPVTVEAVVKTDVNSGYHYAVVNGGETGSSYGFYLNIDSGPSFGLAFVQATPSNNCVKFYPMGTPVIGNWYYFALSWDGTNNAIGRKNDETYTSPVYNREYGPEVNLRISGATSTEYFWDGIIDEVRISKINRSSEWMETTYSTINDSSNFFGIGPEETAP